MWRQLWHLTAGCLAQHGQRPRYTEPRSNAVVTSRAGACPALPQAHLRPQRVLGALSIAPSISTARRCTPAAHHQLGGDELTSTAAGAMPPQRREPRTPEDAEAFVGQRFSKYFAETQQWYDGVVEGVDTEVETDEGCVETGIYFRVL